MNTIEQPAGESMLQRLTELAPERIATALHPPSLAALTLDFRPDSSQYELLDTPSPRVILNCSRQWGKSTVAVIKALHRAFHHDRSEILVASPSDRQSAEFLRKTERLVRQLNIPVRRDCANRRILFPNSSRIVPLPCSEATTRGFFWESWTQHLLPGGRLPHRNARQSP